jgi:hypothetical protein
VHSVTGRASVTLSPFLALMLMISIGFAGEVDTKALPGGVFREDYWKAAYDNTYFFDKCGDPVAGSQYRHALRNFMESCHLQPSVQQILLKAADDMDRVLGEKYAHRQGAEPFVYDQTSCTQWLHARGMSEARDRLGLFANGKMNVWDALQANCDGSSRVK